MQSHINSKPTLAAQFKNNKLIHDQYKLIQEFFGFNIVEASKKNLQQVRHLLSQQALTAAEQKLFVDLMQNFSLKHGTNAADKIKESGKMQAVRFLEASGLTKTNRHTPTQSGTDLSIFAVFGIGAHKIPKFVADSKDIVTAQLAAMEKNDPLTTKRLWVSGHLSEYQQESRYEIKIGDMFFAIQHHKDMTKTYRLTYPSGECKEWNQAYQNEVFAGYETAPGVALQFIYLLRLLGAEKNPLVKKLYDLALAQSESYQPLLEKLFSNLLMGWVYPEAKIIGELNVDQDYIAIHKNDKESGGYDSKFRAVEDAVEAGNIKLLKAYIKKGYPLTAPGENLLVSAFEHIHDPVLRMTMFLKLIKHGVRPIGDDRKHFVELITEKGTAEELDFFLSQEFADVDEPLIKRRIDPNLSCKENSSYIDLVDLACGHDYTGQKLAVLKKHGADFKKNGHYYLKAAINATKGGYSYTNHVNYTAITFLHDEGVNADSEEIYNDTPLMAAVRNGDAAVVEFLVEKMHVDVNKQLRYYSYSLLAGQAFYDDPTSGMTALHFAAGQGNQALVKYLLEHGANPNLKSDAGETPLDRVPDDAPALKGYLSTYTAKNNKDENVVAAPVNAQSAVSNNRQIHHHKVAVLLTGTRQDGKRYVLLGKRRSNAQLGHEKEPERYCFPGGSADKKDASLQAAALRELFEETSVDIGKIPTATVTELGTFAGFEQYDHESTTFYLVDVGAAPIQLHGCDDLVDAKKVMLDKLCVDDKKPIAQCMQYDGNTILGSNALLIKHCILNQSPALSEAQKANIQKQLLIEAQGYSLLRNLIKKTNAEDLIPGSPAWAEMLSLIENDAHLYNNDHSRGSLAVALLEKNAPAAIDILKEHGDDIGAWSSFEVNGKEYYGPAILYAVAANNLSLVEYLSRLNKEYQTHSVTVEQVLRTAAEQGSTEIFKFLLDQGLNPNRSLEYRERIGSNIERPLLAHAITHKQLAFVKLMLQDGRVYLNRERSHAKRHTTLMKAIIRDNKEAAFTLLASNRLDLSVKNNPKDDSYYGKSNIAQNAAEMAGAAGWKDVADVIFFHSRHKDMNDYLRKLHLPQMDEFLCTEDENQKPTIHFISADINKLKELQKVVGSDAKIHEQHGGYYLRLGSVRLRRLVANKSIADYLIKYTRQSIMWSVRTDEYRLLQYQLVSNKLEALNANMFDLDDQFNALEQKSFYAQLIKENVSIGNVILDLDYKNKNVTSWLMAAVSWHDKIKQATLACDDSHPLTMENAEWRDKAFECALSLQHLENLTCQDCPFAYLYALLERIKKCEKFNFAIKVEGNYTQEQYAILVNKVKELNLKQGVILCSAAPEQQSQLDEIVFNNRMEFYLQTDPAFVEKVKEVSDVTQTWVYISDDRPLKDVIQNRLLNEIQLKKSSPKKLSIDPDISAENDRALCCFLRKNTTVESIKLSCGKLERLDSLLNFIAASKQLPLKELDIGFSNMDEKDIVALVSVLKIHPLQVLNLDFCKLKADKPEVINVLAKAIADHQGLINLDLTSLEFANSKLKDMFFEELGNSKTLLNIRDWGWINKHPDIKAMLEKNCERVLQKNEVASDLQPGLLQCFDSPVFKRQRVAKETDEKSNTLELESQSVLTP